MVFNRISPLSHTASHSAIFSFVRFLWMKLLIRNTLQIKNTIEICALITNWTHRFCWKHFGFCEILNFSILKKNAKKLRLLIFGIQNCPKTESRNWMCWKTVFYWKEVWVFAPAIGGSLFEWILLSYRVIIFHLGVAGR